MSIDIAHSAKADECHFRFLWRRQGATRLDLSICRGIFGSRSPESLSRSGRGPVLSVTRRSEPVHGELLNWPDMWRFDMQWYEAMHTIRKGHVRWLTIRRCTRSTCLRSLPVWYRQQRPVIDCMAFCATSRHLRQILLDSGSDRDASSANPRPTRLGPSVRRGRISMMIRKASSEAGPAPWRSSQLRSSHAWVRAFRLSRPVLTRIPR
jgi:hypothetical protein